MGLQDALRNHPAFGGLVGGAILGAGTIGIVNIIRGRIKKRASKKISSTKRRITTKRRSKKKVRKTSKTAFQRRRSKAFRNAKSKKIKFTKNGQPYIILKSGKARFIKRKSARLRKIRKGGFS